MNEALAIKLRRQGLSIRDIAGHIGCAEHQVQYVMRKNGLAGEYRAKPHRRVKRSMVDTDWMLNKILERYDVVTIERGVGGGYIAYVEEASGDLEEETIKEAIRAAFAARRKQGG